MTPSPATTPETPSLTRFPSPATTPKTPPLTRSPSPLPEFTIQDTATPKPPGIPTPPHPPKYSQSFSKMPATPAVELGAVLSPATYTGPAKPFATAHAKKRAPAAGAGKKAWSNTSFEVGELRRCKDSRFSLVWVGDPFDEKDMWD